MTAQSLSTRQSNRFDGISGGHSTEFSKRSAMSIGTGSSVFSSDRTNTLIPSETGPAGQEGSDSLLLPPNRFEVTTTVDLAALREQFHRLGVQLQIVVGPETDKALIDALVAADITVVHDPAVEKLLGKAPTEERAPTTSDGAPFSLSSFMAAARALLIQLLDHPQRKSFTIVVLLYGGALTVSYFALKTLIELSDFE